MEIKKYNVSAFFLAHPIRATKGEFEAVGFVNNRRELSGDCLDSPFERNAECLAVVTTVDVRYIPTTLFLYNLRNVATFFILTEMIATTPLFVTGNANKVGNSLMFK